MTDIFMFRNFSLDIMPNLSYDSIYRMQQFIIIILGKDDRNNNGQ